MVTAFGGGLSLSKFFWKSAYSRSNMKPKSAKIHSKTGSEIDQGIALLVSGASARLHVPFILHSFSFFLPFASMSFHFPFIFLVSIPMCTHFRISFLHLHAWVFLSVCIHFLSFPFMSFHFLSKVMEMALWLGQGTKCKSISYR